MLLLGTDAVVRHVLHRCTAAAAQNMSATDYVAKKEAVADELVARLEAAVLPGLREAVLFRCAQHIMTTTNREDTITVYRSLGNRAFNELENPLLYIEHSKSGAFKTLEKQYKLVIYMYHTPNMHRCMYSILIISIAVGKWAPLEHTDDSSTAWMAATAPSPPEHPWA